MGSIFIPFNKMTVKILVTAIGQQIIAGVKQIENKETKELVGYWLSQPRLVQYQRDEEGQVGVNFGAYCLVSDENEFSLRSDHVVAILEPRQDVVDGYTKLVFPEDGTDTADSEALASDVNLDDGAAGAGTEGSPEAADVDLGSDEAVVEAVA